LYSNLFRHEKISKFIFREYLIKVISVQTGWKYAKVILKKRANDITETEKTELSDF